MQEVMKLADLERSEIEKAMLATSGCRTKSAELLGISVRTLQRKLHKYGWIDRWPRLYAVGPKGAPPC